MPLLLDWAYTVKWLANNVIKKQIAIIILFFISLNFVVILKV
jgi:hypothetical protein